MTERYFVRSGIEHPFEVVRETTRHGFAGAYAQEVVAAVTEREAADRAMALLTMGEPQN